MADAEIIDAEIVPAAVNGLPQIRIATGRDVSRAGLPMLSPTSYQVPRRFGTAAILGFTTLMAMMFAAVRFFNGPWWLYMFLSSLVFTTAVSQMVFPKSPRLSSVVSGSILLPVIVVIVFAGRAFTQSHLSGNDFIGMIFLTIPAAIFGAFVGYVAGMLAAGVFLILDRLDSLFSSDDR